MSIHPGTAAASLALSALLISGCKPSGETGSSAALQPASTGAKTTETPSASTRPNADGTIPSGTGVEKAKPAAGKGNVQGKVLYNGKPAAGVEVRLCEKFSQFLGGCSGETFTTKTDSMGEYLIKNVPPRIYEGLMVKVFDTDYYVFATSGIIQSAKYQIEADRTYFAPDTSLFKSDLKLLSPRAGSKIGPSDIEVKWAPYPDAAYYKLSIHGDGSTGAKTEYDYIDKRVDGVLYALDKPLSPGSYDCKVTAYNSSDIKLSQTPNDLEFTVKADAAK
jgi:hypothetical protein